MAKKKIRTRVKREPTCKEGEKKRFKGLAEQGKRELVVYREYGEVRVYCPFNFKLQFKENTHYDHFYVDTEQYPNELYPSSDEREKARVLIVSEKQATQLLSELKEAELLYRMRNQTQRLADSKCDSLLIRICGKEYKIAQTECLISRMI